MKKICPRASRSSSSELEVYSCSSKSDSDHWGKVVLVCSGSVQTAWKDRVAVGLLHVCCWNRVAVEIHVWSAVLGHPRAINYVYLCYSMVSCTISDLLANASV